MIGLNCILLCLNDSSKIAKSELFVTNPRVVVRSINMIKRLFFKWNRSSNNMQNAKCRISRQTVGATLFGQLEIGQLFFDQLNLANYFMQIRLDLEGLKI